MSYYKPSFSQTVAMSRGSRGFSSPRGGMSFRGNGGRGSSWGDRGGSRGYSSNRGGGRFSSSWNSGNGSFESRSRYNSSGGGGERYRRPDEGSYKRSYRSDANNSYSGRDASSHRSPERKRMRAEAPSSRRSHDGYGDSYGGSAGRYEGGYGERRSFTDERRPSFRSREDYRKPSMPSAASSVRQSSRGGYRGRVSGGRGIRGSRSLRDTIMRRRGLESGYLRKRGAPNRSNIEYLRRLKLNRLRSQATRLALKRRAEKRSKSSEKDESDKEQENSDEEKDEEAKKKEGSEEKEVEGEGENKSPVKTTPKKDKEKKEGEKKEKGDDESDKEEKKSGDEEDQPRSRYTGKPFIKLTCSHCNKKCVTFNEYSIHLSSGQHISAMRRIAIKQKAQLARMRLNQRNAQRDIEKSDEDLAPRTNFCPLCKLNYRQLKAKHRMSDAHRNMKKFLMPYCRVCRLTFKSPMLYENHMCSLSHIKRKARSDGSDDKYDSDKEPASPTEEDLENFMTLDSVGDVDDEEGGTKKVKTEAEENGEAEKKKHLEEQINVGEEHVKKVEVHYCDLCRIYLSRYTSAEKEIKEHCRGRMHLQRYVRHKEVKDLRRQAERIHRKTQAAREAKEKDKDKKKDGEAAEGDDKAVKEIKKEKDDKEEDAGEDQVWADVDKDLGEILAEVNTEGGNKSSDEDDDSRPNGERYDRFRYSEKGEGKDGKKRAEGEDKDEQADEDNAEEEGQNEGDKDEDEEEEEKEETTDAK